MFHLMYYLLASLLCPIFFITFFPSHYIFFKIFRWGKGLVWDVRPTMAFMSLPLIDFHSTFLASPKPTLLFSAIGLSDTQELPHFIKQVHGSSSFLLSVSLSSYENIFSLITYNLLLFLENISLILLIVMYGGPPKPPL